MTNNNIELFLEKAENVKFQKKEVLRYLGYMVSDCAEFLDEVYDDYLKIYNEAVSYKCVVSKSSVSQKGNSVIFDFCEIESPSLCKNLNGCESAYIMAATVGVGVDRLIKKLSVTSPLNAMVIDAMASAGIEAWCDMVNSALSSREDTKPRFSPGYGGVSLCCQPKVLGFVEAQKRVGITLNNSFMMCPQKSVSAFIGIKKKV